jgi:hypothetical protein
MAESRYCGNRDDPPDQKTRIGAGFVGDERYVRPYTVTGAPPCGHYDTGMAESAPLQEELRYE